MIDDEDGMNENGYCECPICEYLRNLPVPRNREERREQEKMIKKDLKVRHEVHMVWTPFDAVVEDDDADDVNDSDEIEEELNCEEEPLQRN